MDDLLNWPILASLGEDRLRVITRAHVYNKGKAAWIVDREDNVFSVKRQAFTGDINVQKMPALCGQRIRSFSTSGSHHLALTDGGVLYGWNISDDGEEAEDNTLKHAEGNTLSTDPNVLLSNQKVMTMACGEARTVAITANGKAKMFGSNQIMQLYYRTNYSLPPVVIWDRNAVAAGASGNNIIILTLDGTVYTMGDNNSCGQLGNGKSYGNSTLCQVEIVARVVQIAVGSGHVLALTEDGRILAWGKNDHYQVSSSGTNSLQPAIVRGTDSVKFVEIAANNFMDLSAALSSDGVVYIWGLCGTDNQSTPIPTKLRNLQEAFARHGGWGTYKTIVVELNSSMYGVWSAFENESLSDCRFLVENKVIHAQKAILKSESDYFKAMFSLEWKESDGEITITNHSYQAYWSLINYLHTAKLEASDDHLLELLELAHETLNEPLVSLCAERLRHKLRPDNIIDTYAVARMLDVHKLLDYCRQYALIFWKRILKAESFQKMKADDVRPFVQFVFEETEINTAPESEEGFLLETRPASNDV